MLSLIYFISGATGLVYEVLWAKYLALLFGSTALANTVVLATFLGGLAAGAAWLGPFADRSPDPLKLYAKLELALALAGLLPLFGLGAVSWAYLSALSAGAPASAAAALRVILIATVLLPPTVLMGATLPALGRYLTLRGEEVGRAASWLYAVNSAGAVAGCLAAGYWLIPRFGLDASTGLAAAGNLVSGLGALALASHRGVGPAAPGPEEPAALPDPLKKILLGAAFLSGLISLVYELAWVRLVAVVTGSSAYSFSAMLAAFISGIALGAALARRRPVSSLPPYLAFGLAELAAGAAVALTLPFYDRLPYAVLILGGLFNRVPLTFYLFEAGKFLLCFAVMIAPTAMIGMTLPLAAAALSRRERAGKDLGRLWAFNTAGCVAGAALGGLWLLSALGLRGVFAAGAAASVLAGFVVVSTARASWLMKAASVGLAAAALAAADMGARSWDLRMLTRGDFRTPLASAYPSFARYREQTGRDSMLFYQDDREATVSVERDRWGGLSLKINGKVDASTIGDMPNQMLVAHVPLLLRPQSREALVIGLGSGVTVGSALAHPVERVDVVEISRAVAEAARLVAAQNRSALGDPRVNVILDDAKAFLKTARRRYDLIVSEPSNTWVAGAASLYTREFYRDARARLKDGGLFVQWFHLYEMNDASLRLVLRTFASEFKDLSLWETTPGKDLLVVGSGGPVEADFAAMARAFERREVRADLARIGISRLTTLLSLQAADDAAARAVSGEGPLNEDRFPILEYEAPKAFWLNRSAELLKGEGQRGDAAARRRLYLWQCLKQRGRPLEPAEREDWRRCHSGGNPQVAELAKSWTRF
ncbi:MAG: fused MFS/spermidine synthase [Elusimicrobia bacterium]|nr:fused MFS/spermidine synthase [Elusimicrobiota bacterium]